MDMDNITFVAMGRPPTIPTGDVNQAEWQEVLDRLDDVENNLSLADMSDVDLTGLADNYVLVYDAVSGDFQSTALPAGSVITGDQALYPTTENSTAVLFGDGISYSNGFGITLVDVSFAGSGSALTVSRSDHAHTAKLVSLTTGTATGNLSSGTRALRNTSGPALASGITYDVTGEFVVRARNNVNSGTVNLLCRIGAEGSYPQRSRNVQTVGGVPVDQLIKFHAVITGTGASVTEYFAVQYSSGDATDLRDHEIMIQYDPRR